MCLLLSCETGVHPGLAANRIAFMMTLLDPAAAAQELYHHQQQGGVDAEEGPLHQHLHNRAAAGAADDTSPSAPSGVGAVVRPQPPQESLI
jgi:hypothetical protein